MPIPTAFGPQPASMGNPWWHDTQVSLQQIATTVEHAATKICEGLEELVKALERAQRGAGGGPSRGRGGRGRAPQVRPAQGAGGTRRSGGAGRRGGKPGRRRAAATTAAGSP
jgi:hypothetical protein